MCELASDNPSPDEPTVVDIVLVVDAAGLLAVPRASGGESGLPLVVAPDFWFLVASSSYVRDGQATTDLSLAISPPCILSWRSLCASAHGSAGLVLTDVTLPEPKGGSAAILEPVRLDVEERVRPRPVPAMGADRDSPRFSIMTAQRSVATTRVRAKGRAGPCLRFYLTEQDADGAPRPAGYFECRLGLTLV